MILPPLPVCSNPSSDDDSSNRGMRPRPQLLRIVMPYGCSSYTHLKTSGVRRVISA